MKRIFQYRWGLFGVLLVALFSLAACERPFQSGEPVPLTPVTTEGEPVPTLDPTDPSAGGEVEVIDVGGEAVDPEAGEGATPASEGGDGDAAAGAEATPEDAPEEGETIPTTEPAGPPEGIHVVQPGETLFSLAQRYGVSVDDIVAANNLLNPDRLEVDQELVIPEPGFAENTPEPEDTDASDSEAGGEQVHVVRPGDTLFQIGLIYGVSVEELAAYNDIANINQLEVGQEIRIPPQQ